jgi:ribosome maturation factor RimP
LSSTQRKRKLEVADESDLPQEPAVSAPADVAEEEEWAKAHFLFVPTSFQTMALQLDQIRELAQRVAASHHLELVEIEFSGGAKHRTLRVFIEKDAEARAQLIASAAQEENDLPKGVPVEKLSGVTHEDCVAFTHDFGTVLDIEDLVPGSEYTLEVSSPGLERKLSRPEDFARFLGSLLKVQTFSAIGSLRKFEGRLTAFEQNQLTLDLAAIKLKGKAKKNAATGPTTLQIAFANIEKANLIPEL